jgi:hypothetical protein
VLKWWRCRVRCKGAEAGAVAEESTEVGCSAGGVKRCRCEVVQVLRGAEEFAEVVIGSADVYVQVQRYSVQSCSRGAMVQQILRC